MKRLIYIINLICVLTVLALPQAAHADTSSPNKGYDLQTTGANRGQWGIILNNNFNIVDNNIAGYHTVDVSGSSNVTVSSTDAQNIYQRLTGTLTGNIQYILPSKSGIYLIDNETTGTFTVTVNNMLGGTGIVVARGAVNLIYSDATNSKVVAGNNVFSGILPVANGGTGSAFFGVTGPTTARTYTLPDVSTTLLTTNAAVTVSQGGTGAATLAGHGVLIGNGTGTINVTAAGTTGQVFTSNGASSDPTWQAAPAAASASTSVAGIVQLTVTSDVNTGTSNTLAVTPAALKGGLGVSKTFKSAQTSFTVSSQVSVPHGLGAIPNNVIIELVCASAELGYSVGDIIYNAGFSIDNTGSSGALVRGISVSADSSNIYVSTGSTINLIQKSGGSQGSLTFANWKFIVIGQI